MNSRSDYCALSVQKKYLKKYTNYLNGSSVTKKSHINQCFSDLVIKADIFWHGLCIP